MTLKEYRKSNKIRQTELAAKAGITQGFYSQIENKGTTSLSAAIAIRDATGGAVTVDALVRRESEAA